MLSIKNDSPVGYDELEWESVLHGSAGEYGEYTELAILPDKIARFLYKYHSEDYTSLNLQILPIDRSNVSVHGILKQHKELYNMYIYMLSYYIMHILHIMLISLPK